MENNLIGPYLLGPTLGAGMFAKVKLGEDVNRKKVAIKIFDKRRLARSPKTFRQVEREINAIRVCKHPNIVKFYEVLETRYRVFLVMEHLEAGELYDYIEAVGQLPEAECKRLFYQMISALRCCHRNGVYHRDLKPENILLDEHLNIRLVDFGLASYTKSFVPVKDDDKPAIICRTQCGSPHYAAPEVLTGKQYAGDSADLWSIGIVLYAMLCGKLPFTVSSKSIPELIRKILSGRYHIPPHVSPEAVSLITGILRLDPSDRLTIPEILDHPFLEGEAERQTSNETGIPDSSSSWSSSFVPFSPGFFSPSITHNNSLINHSSTPPNNQNNNGNLITPLTRRANGGNSNNSSGNFPRSLAFSIPVKSSSSSSSSSPTIAKESDIPNSPSATASSIAQHVSMFTSPNPSSRQSGPLSWCATNVLSQQLEQSNQHEYIGANQKELNGVNADGAGKECQGLVTKCAFCNRILSVKQENKGGNIVLSCSLSSQQENVDTLCTCDNSKTNRGRISGDSLQNSQVERKSVNEKSQASSSSSSYSPSVANFNINAITQTQRQLFIACEEGDLDRVVNILAEDETSRWAPVLLTANQHTLFEDRNQSLSTASSPSPSICPAPSASSSSSSTSPREGTDSKSPSLVSSVHVSEAGIDLRAKSKDNWTALHYASRGGHVEVVHALLTSLRSMDIDAKTKAGWTALMLAADKGYSAVARLLVQYGAAIHLSNNAGKSAIFLARESSHTYIARLLTAKSSLRRLRAEQTAEACSSVACPLVGNVGSRSFMALNAEASSSSSSSSSSSEQTKGINEAKQDVTVSQSVAISHEGIGDFAVSNTMSGIVKRDEAVVEATTYDRKSKTHINPALLVLEGYSNVSNLTHQLFGAAERGDIKEAKHLLSLNISASPTSLPTKSSLSTHSSTPSSEITTGAPLSSSLAPSSSSSLLSQQVKGFVPASSNHRVQSAGRLLSANARGIDNWTPLHFAARKGHADMVALLLQYNADINARSKSNWTPLMMACCKGHLRAVSMLLKHDPNLKITNADGQTASDLAHELLQQSAAIPLPSSSSRSLSSSSSSSSSPSAQMPSATSSFTSASTPAASSNVLTEHQSSCRRIVKLLDKSTRRRARQ